jgi:outer membrane receptor for ferrienterochelin and colicins
MKILFLIIIIFSFKLFSADITGVVKHKNEPLIRANVYIDELKKLVSTNELGKFIISDIPIGTYELKVSYVGFLGHKEKITINNENDNLALDIEMQEDKLQREGIVVTATRTKIPIYDSPIKTNNITNKLYESVQAVSMSEGLSFSPGLRMETNCGNCGFSQVRMNGLDGHYSQILINSRPIYSALTGIYGLEMIPANLIERVEVVRGAGSLMYGGNAIGGIINVITKEPTTSNYEISNNTGITNFEKFDNTLNFNANLVSDNLMSGVSIFGSRRNRENWDANNDGFSQLVELDNTSFGFDAFYNTSENAKLRFNLFSINEERRGGNKFNLQPHQADITEYLKHNIISTNLSYEEFIPKLNTTYSIYNSLQKTKRNSYYGAGGRVINEPEIDEDDLLALNGYGNSDDFVAVIGMQFSSNINKFTFVYGSELNHNSIQDRMLGYNRIIEQDVTNFGNYLQVHYELNSKFTLLGGLRYEHIILDGNYNLDIDEFENNRKFDIIVPRLSLMYSYDRDLKFRASFAQGFRAPQAFDEDLHIETVGGAARFINISNDLRPEYSENYTISIDKTIFINDLQFNIVIDGFYTDLKNAFILSDPQEIESGVSILNKRNSKGSRVFGTNLETSLAFSNNLYLQAGFTIQRALYKEDEVIWESKVENPDSLVVVSNMLRTPNNYGYFNINYNFTDRLTSTLSSVYTGTMLVPHIVDIDNEFTVIKETKPFFELNFKLSYTIAMSNNELIVSIGMQNIFNSYQNDFDRGIDRDASYIYGPMRPRTPFISFKYGG